LTGIKRRRRRMLIMASEFARSVVKAFTGWLQTCPAAWCGSLASADDAPPETMNGIHAHREVWSHIMQLYSIVTGRRQVAPVVWIGTVVFWVWTLVVAVLGKGGYLFKCRRSGDGRGIVGCLLGVCMTKWCTGRFGRGPSTRRSIVVRALCSGRSLLSVGCIWTIVLVKVAGCCRMLTDVEKGRGAGQTGEE
jgi:hypothetical protein